MIVNVLLEVVSDEGAPIIVAGRRELVVHMTPDYEGNLLRAAATLEAMVTDAHTSVHEQVANYRASEFNPG